MSSTHRSDLLALVNARLGNSSEPNPALCAPEVLVWLEENRPDLLREAALLGLEQLAYCSAEPGAFSSHVRPDALGRQRLGR
jgi:hypothetical protein